MLTLEEIKEYSDTLIKYPDLFSDESFVKLRLCYLKEEKLYVLCSIMEELNWQSFTDFVNQQEDLTVAMLVKSEIQHEKGYPLGIRTTLEDGQIHVSDMEITAKRLYRTILEAAVKL